MAMPVFLFVLSFFVLQTQNVVLSDQLCKLEKTLSTLEKQKEELEKSTARLTKQLERVKADLEKYDKEAAQVPYILAGCFNSLCLRRLSLPVFDIQSLVWIYHWSS